jgi:hypothetical protein
MRHAHPIASELLIRLVNSPILSSLHRKQNIIILRIRIDRNIIQRLRLPLRSSILQSDLLMSSLFRLELQSLFNLIREIFIFDFRDKTSFFTKVGDDMGAFALLCHGFSRANAATTLALAGRIFDWWVYASTFIRREIFSTKRIVCVVVMATSS